MTALRTLAVLAALSAAPRAALAFEPTGELTFNAGGLSAGGAAFDGERVVGPSVNVSRQESGGWAGDLSGANMELAVSASRLSGAGVSLALEQRPNALKVEGLFFGQRVRLALDEKKFVGRYGRCSFELTRKAPGIYRGDLGCMRTGSFPSTARVVFRLTGQAADATPPLPQMILALLAVLPS
ncbi:MAG TPA: hypothetical protein VFP50_16515 [Anaeromyxobacteraceae bacterium]|nr:hypothetical protein [Anaeromyxobacteraceae bacterium]